MFGNFDVSDMGCRESSNETPGLTAFPKMTDFVKGGGFGNYQVLSLGHVWF